jgi:hypothetical protein
MAAIVLNGGRKGQSIAMSVDTGTIVITAIGFSCFQLGIAITLWWWCGCETAPTTTTPQNDTVRVTEASPVFVMVVEPEGAVRVGKQVPMCDAA